MKRTRNLDLPMSRLGAALGVIALTACPVPAFADPQGSIIIRLDDGAGEGRCIAPTDILHVKLTRVIVEKKSKFLGLINDDQIGLTFTTRLTGASGANNKTAAFAKVISQPVTQFDSGQISLANEQQLLSRFALTSKADGVENVFSTVDIEVGIVRTKGKSTAAKLLFGAISATQGLTLPPNPFSPIFETASKYVDGLFKPLIDSAAQEKEAVTHNIAMTILGDGCKSANAEKTGTIAIVDASDDVKKPGFVDTDRSDDYCFSAVLKPVVILKAGKKDKDGKCPAENGYVSVKNSYMTFYKNAVPQTKPEPVADNAGQFLLLPKTNNFNKLRLGLETKGLSELTAEVFSQALLSDQPSAKVAKAFRLDLQSVEAYREAITRCEAHGDALDECFQ